MFWVFGNAAAPLLYLPVNNADTQIVKINFSFYHLGGMQHYDLQIDTSASFSSPLLRDSIGVIDYSSSNAGELISKTVLHHYYATKHYRRVRGRTMNDTSDWSETRVFTTKQYPFLVSPTPSQSYTVTPGAIWRNIGGSTSYQIQVGNTTVFISPIYIYDVTGVSVNQPNNSNMSQGFTDLPLGEYFLRMKAYNAVDSSSWTPAVAFSFISPSVVSENELLKFSVFPNPANEQITILSQGDIQVNIFNAEGKLVFQSSIASISEVLNISCLSQGTYFLQVNAANKMVLQKLIVTE
ncbi:MAG: T9SS type A sorting domain-containing protein [Flavobacteriales bacterium]